LGVGGRRGGIEQVISRDVYSREKEKKKKIKMGNQGTDKGPVGWFPLGKTHTLPLSMGTKGGKSIPMGGGYIHSVLAAGRKKRESSTGGIGTPVK